LKLDEQLLSSLYIVVLHLRNATLLCLHQQYDVAGPEMEEVQLHELDEVHSGEDDDVQQLEEEQPAQPDFQQPSALQHSDTSATATSGDTASSAAAAAAAAAAADTATSTTASTSTTDSTGTTTAATSASRSSRSSVQRSAPQSTGMRSTTLRHCSMCLSKVSYSLYHNVYTMHQSSAMLLLTNVCAFLSNGSSHARFKQCISGLAARAHHL
jgi:hypothetical protein